MEVKTFDSDNVKKKMYFFKKKTLLYMEYLEKYKINSWGLLQ